VSRKQISPACGIVEKFLLSAEDGQPLSAAVTGHLAKLRQSGLSVKTLWNHRSAISQWFEFLMERGAMPAGDNPCRRVKLAALPKPAPRWLEDEELAAALNAARKAGCSPEVTFAVYSGLRVGEMARLQWADVDLERKQVLVRQTKSGRPKAVPLCQAARAALMEQALKSRRFAYVFPSRQTYTGGVKFRDRQRCAHSWRNLFQPVQRAVPKFTAGGAKGCGRAWHLLRHTYASRLAQAGISIQKISAFMGHADIKVTADRYAFLRPGYDPDVEAAGPKMPPDADADLRAG
jgi:integrase